jgi:hypothetical protein
MVSCCWTQKGVQVIERNKMGDDDKNNKKKNPAPTPRSIRRKRKKGPTASVKVPLGL